MAFCLAVCFILAKHSAASPPPILFNTLDYPGAVFTRLTGIQNGTIVGTYAVSNFVINEGFTYDSSGFLPIRDPHEGLFGTWVSAISGNQIVGSYYDSASLEHGFVYDGSTYQDIDDPLRNSAVANSDELHGISGNIMVGYFIDNSNAVHGYIYDGAQFQTLNYPAGSITVPRGIEGNKIVGSYFMSGGDHGWLYNGSTFTPIEDPLAGVHGTDANGISGNYIVGSYTDPNNTIHGFYFDGTNYYTVDFPGSLFTEVVGIQGNTIVGDYSLAEGDGINSLQGFIATIPEPSTWVLALLSFAIAFAWQLKFSRTAKLKSA